MARPLRIERARAWYHVTARGTDRRTIFQDDIDRWHWLGLLPEWTEVFRVRLYAYVLMDNHYHLILETVEANLARAMQWLQTSYSTWFNRRHARVGPLFQGRYYAVVVDAAAWGWELSRYVHLNPVRVRSLRLDKGARAADRLGVSVAPTAEEVQRRLEHLRRYRWSSYRAYAGFEEVPLWLTMRTVLGLGGHGSLAAQRAAYRRYVEDAVREGLARSPWGELVGRLVLGGKEFVERVRREVRFTPREQPDSKRLMARTSWEQVQAAVAAVRGETWEALSKRRADWGRDLAWWLGRRLCGMGLVTLGKASGGANYATVSAAIRRVRERLNHDRELARRAREVEERLASI